MSTPAAAAAFALSVTRSNCAYFPRNASRVRVESVTS
jgi:hypothetical protein